MELRLAVGAFVLGAALAAAALAGCLGDAPMTDDAHESPLVASSADLEDYPPCPDRTRVQPISNAEILDDGHTIRAFYASSSDHRPCGFAFGENARALVVVLLTTDPDPVRADLNPRCVDLALPRPVEEGLELVLLRPGTGERPPPLDARLRQRLVGQDGCRAVHEMDATLDVD